MNEVVWVWERELYFCLGINEQYNVWWWWKKRKERERESSLRKIYSCCFFFGEQNAFNKMKGKFHFAPLTYGLNVTLEIWTTKFVTLSLRSIKTHQSAAEVKSNHQNHATWPIYNRCGMVLIVGSYLRVHFNEFRKFVSSMWRTWKFIPQKWH